MSSEELEEIEKSVRETEEGSRPKYEALQAKYEAEQARRASLHPTERLVEDGTKLRQAMEENADMVALLEVPLSDRSCCRAGDCFYPDSRITQEFRVRVENVRGELSHYRTRQYYHLLCFEAMTNLEEMIASSKFGYDVSGGWGLMVTQWFEHRGWIDLDKVVQYIKNRNDWEKEHPMPPALLRFIFNRDDKNSQDVSETNATNATDSCSKPGTQADWKQEETPPVLQGHVATEPKDCVMLSEVMVQPDVGEGRLQGLYGGNEPLLLQALHPGSDVGAETAGVMSRDVRQQEERLSAIRMRLRRLWDRLHADHAPPVPETHIAAHDLDSDCAEGTGEVQKRRHSDSNDEEVAEVKRRKVQEDGNATKGKQPEKNSTTGDIHS